MSARPARPQASRLRRAICRGCRRHVDAEPRRRQALGEQRAQDRARADAEIEDAQRIAPPSADGLERDLDESSLSPAADPEHRARPRA